MKTPKHHHPSHAQHACNRCMHVAKIKPAGRVDSLVTSVAKPFKSLFLYMVIMILMLTPTGLAAQHVSIQMNLPPPGTLNPEDIMDIISFNNTSTNTLHVTMMVTIEEGEQGLVFSGMSSVFSLPPGMSVPDYTVFEPVEVEYADPLLEGYVIQTNNMPGGDYVVCITLFDAEMGDEVGYHCVPHSVFHPAAPMLVYPADGDVVYEPAPVFVWLPPPPPLPPVGLGHWIRLVEVHEEQLPYEAMQSNPAWFEDHQAMTATYPYPADAAPLEPGMTYAWQVQALMGDGFPVGENQGYSEIQTFMYSPKYVDDGMLEWTSPADGEEIDQPSPLFRWHDPAFPDGLPPTGYYYSLYITKLDDEDSEGDSVYEAFTGLSQHMLIYPSAAQPLTEGEYRAQVFRMQDPEHIATADVTIVEPVDFDADIITLPVDDDGVVTVPPVLPGDDPLPDEVLVAASSPPLLFSSSDPPLDEPEDEPEDEPDCVTNMITESDDPDFDFDLSTRWEDVADRDSIEGQIRRGLENFVEALDTGQEYDEEFGVPETPLSAQVLWVPDVVGGQVNAYAWALMTRPGQTSRFIRATEDLEAIVDGSSTLKVTAQSEECETLVAIVKASRIEAYSYAFDPVADHVEVLRPIALIGNLAVDYLLGIARGSINSLRSFLLNQAKEAAEEEIKARFEELEKKIREIAEDYIRENLGYEVIEGLEIIDWLLNEFQENPENEVLEMVKEELIESLGEMLGINLGEKLDSIEDLLEQLENPPFEAILDNIPDLDMNKINAASGYALAEGSITHTVGGNTGTAQTRSYVTYQREGLEDGSETISGGGRYISEVIVSDIHESRLEAESDAGGKTGGKASGNGHAKASLSSFTVTFAVAICECPDDTFIDVFYNMSYSDKNEYGHLSALFKQTIDNVLDDLPSISRPEEVESALSDGIEQFMNESR